MKDGTELRPIRETKSDYDQIEQKIKDMFIVQIYSWLLREFQQPIRRLKNSIEDLLSAIQSGRLTYYRGKFSGKLNASLSLELRALGAKWDRMQKCYSIPLAELPMDVRNVISSSAYKFEEKIDKIDQRLASIVPSELASELKLAKLFDRSLWKTEKDFQSSVRKLTVAPEWTNKRRKDLAEEWQNNMKLWIKDFTEKQIKELRSSLKESIFAGNRYEHAVSSIQKSYGVTERKAKFLARQETALAMTNYKYSRYEEAGISNYRWKTVSDNHDTSFNNHIKGNVRFSHWLLNDKIFNFNKPPITTAPTQPARRNNPGQDFNCRCVAIPIVKFKKS